MEKEGGGSVLLIVAASLLFLWWYSRRAATLAAASVKPAYTDPAALLSAGEKCALSGGVNCQAVAGIYAGGIYQGASTIFGGGDNSWICTKVDCAQG
jgi:hypothetical protein